LSRTRTCTHPPVQCAKASALGEWGRVRGLEAYATWAGSLPEGRMKVHLYQAEMMRPPQVFAACGNLNASVFQAGGEIGLNRLEL
jgi:hypothetical protein